MAFTRARALRSLQTSLRHSGQRAAARGPSRAQQLVHKRYSSGGGAHGEHQESSDIPWAIGAVVVTVPATWYLLPDSSSHDSHHGHGDHAEHPEEEDVKEEEAPQEEVEAPQEEAPKEEAPKDEPPKDEAPKEDSKEEAPAQEETPAAPEPKQGSKSSEPTSTGPATRDSKPTGKGMVSSDSAGASETRKSEPDSKGAMKKRVDSGLQKDLGVGTQDAPNAEGGPVRDSAATSKEAKKGSKGDISAKQFGLSTTPTRHSTQIDQDPEKSKKGEGTPETAKSMGTVDPQRPAK